MPRHANLLAHRIYDPAVGEHVYHDPATSDRAGCTICQSIRHEEAIRLVRERRMSRRDMVICSHSWTSCDRRDELELVYRDEAEYCGECDAYYCTDHHHLRPTGVTGQRCDSCGIRPRCISTYRCTDCDTSYCDSCSHDCEPDEDAEVEWRGVDLLFLGDPDEHPGSERYIGFEVEVECGSGESLPGMYGVVEDGSLTGGIEVLTPPARGERLTEIIHEVTSGLKYYGWEGTEACGLHTHIDLRDKVDDMTFLSHLFATAYAVEDVLYTMQSRDRHRSSYAIPLRRGYRFYDGYGMKARDFEYVYNKLDKTAEAERALQHRRGSKWSDVRYHGFNFHSVFYRGTLECRIHEGTLNPDRMIAWAHLLQAIVARVDRGISYPQIRRLLELPPGPAKLARMARLFSFTPELTDHIRRRMDRRSPVVLTYELGEGKRGFQPEPEPVLKFICGECGVTIPSTLPLGESYHYYTCSRPTPSPERDAYNEADNYIGSLGMLAERRDRIGRVARRILDQAA